MLARLNPEILSGGALLLVAGVYLRATAGLPVGQAEPGPAFFPRILGGLLVVAATAIIVGGLGRSPAPVARQGVAPRASAHDLRWRPITAAALTAAYVALMPVVGFAVATWLYTGTLAVLFGMRRAVQLLLAPAISTLAIYLLFRLGLGVRLP